MLAQLFIVFIAGIGLGAAYALWTADTVERVVNPYTIEPRRNVRGSHPF